MLSRLVNMPLEPPAYGLYTGIPGILSMVRMAVKTGILQYLYNVLRWVYGRDEVLPFRCSWIGLVNLKKLEDNKNTQ
jgi:hypothetical protein